MYKNHGNWRIMPISSKINLNLIIQSQDENAMILSPSIRKLAKNADYLRTYHESRYQNEVIVFKYL